MAGLVIKDVKVRSLSVDYNEVSWELEPTTEDVLDYTFQVFRSEAAMGPFEPISVEFDDQYLYTDNIIKSFHIFRQYFYRIRIKRKDTGSFVEFTSDVPGQDADLVASELRVHIALLMREFIGERCWVLPVRTFGQRCPGCWSETLQKKTRSGCRSCFDTSWVRGYMNPIESWISIDPNPNTEQDTTFGKRQPQDTTARLTYYPPLKPGDLIIAPDNIRWRVVQISQTKHVGTPVHQEVSMHQIPASSIEYIIELDLGKALRNIYLKPERNFTNPQQLEALNDETMEGIFSLYQVRNLP